jgi:hypothetical protein
MKWKTNQPRLVQALPAPKPRNPHVAAGLFRKVGAHTPTTGARRARAQRELRETLTTELPGRGP